MDAIKIVELYKHEDNLNWTKLNHLIISTLGISAGIGFNINKNYVFLKSVIYLLFALGWLIILGFGLSINSGVKNMNYWKSKIIEVEKSIIILIYAPIVRKNFLPF